MRIVIFPIMCHLPRGDKKNSLLMQPSPAAAGRVFLILKSSLNEKQGCALVDDLQASLMSQHNEQ